MMKRQPLYKGQRTSYREAWLQSHDKGLIPNYFSERLHCTTTPSLFHSPPSPLTAEADFDTSVIILEFPSDIDSPVNEVEAPIALKNDEIDEADVQIFIIYLRVINSTNPSLIVTDRIISQGRIVDDDRKSL